MQNRAADDREYWRGVLAAGGVHRHPALDPRPGAGRRRARGADPDRRCGRGRRTGVPLGSLLLAAHAKVLAALSGEHEVGHRLRARRRGTAVAVPADHRARLVARAAGPHARRRARAAGARRLPGRRAAARAGPDRTAFETVFDPAATATCADDTVLWVGVAPPTTAGRAAAALPDRRARRRGRRPDRRLPPHRARADRRRSGRRARRAEPAVRRGARASSSTGWPGPHRELPDRRFHELFEQRVRAAPGRGRRRCTATGSGPTGSSTPGPTGSARALLARGLGREGVVAVVTERNLDWMAAVLAIFKAGGVYLPDRAAPSRPTGSRRCCAAPSAALVLTEPGSTDHPRPGPRRRCPAVQRLLVDDGLRGGPPRRRPRRRRSGPTSSPTSTSPPAPPASPRARCASTRACSTTSTPRSTTWRSARARWSPQTAPQCFDISLWQLVSALLVGGRTLLVEQEVILDVARVRRHRRRRPGRRRAGRALLPRGRADLPGAAPPGAARPALRVGHRRGAEEGAGPALVRRRCPAIKLVNAYGLTETSDDTNHEVMRLGAGGPIGAARAGRCSNVRVYVVDEQLRPVPLGAPGAIVFSGVCVGRGYINDPERTAAGLPAPTRTAPASGSTGAATSAAGARTASWSSSAAGTAR